MAELAMVKTPQGLQPATEADREAIQSWRLGEVVRGKFARMRNGRFHGKFFAMLDLAYDYWEPKGGLIPQQEMRGIQGMTKFLSEHISDSGSIHAAAQAYITELEQDRSDRFPAVEKGREAFRDWVTIEAGHYNLVQTPSGIRRERKSISWSRMDEDAFEALYRDVFNVCWRLILSAHFSTEADAMAAADMMGSFA